jgi:serine phosphatase RsbU (regulator of sigma subunit)
MFGIVSLDAALRAPAAGGPQERIDAILSAVNTFAAHAPAGDDRTLLAFRAR